MKKTANFRVTQWNDSVEATHHLKGSREYSTHDTHPSLQWTRKSSCLTVAALCKVHSSFSKRHDLLSLHAYTVSRECWPVQFISIQLSSVLSTLQSWSCFPWCSSRHEGREGRTETEKNYWVSFLVMNISSPPLAFELFMWIYSFLR